MTLSPFKLSLVALLAAGLGQTALAQGDPAQGSDPETPQASATGTGSEQDIAAQSWNEAVRDVFFTDATMSEIRPTEDVEARWATLDPETKEIAKRDCAAFLIDAGSMGGAGGPSLGDTAPADGAATGGAATDGAATDGAGDAGAPAATDTTTASEAPPSPGNSPLWNQACSLVKSFSPE
ncbi:hypothetical protein C5F48_17395 [Cereibacter changlensis JA139]|uniref:Uncharacterized protein n=2 Tax=Cereibacter changlensis TaxID=402884 RepID=A0A2T4JRP2_9RHOB|nr:hypothetical protein [Cereibacter changlensis]PTE20467.1 hypothetical protein C5F48_17395 [Cereibacter changlensis JA139]PZX54506.1 hypothetical protein LX76_02153 [Cereibacter changlensis]